MSPAASSHEVPARRRDRSAGPCGLMADAPAHLRPLLGVGHALGIDDRLGLRDRTRSIRRARGCRRSARSASTNSADRGGLRGGRGTRGSRRCGGTGAGGRARRTSAGRRRTNEMPSAAPSCSAANSLSRVLPHGRPARRTRPPRAGIAPRERLREMRSRAGLGQDAPLRRMGPADSAALPPRGRLREAARLLGQRERPVGVEVLARPESPCSASRSPGPLKHRAPTSRPRPKRGASRTALHITEAPVKQAIRTGSAWPRWCSERVLHDIAGTELGLKVHAHRCPRRS